MGTRITRPSEARQVWRAEFHEALTVSADEDGDSYNSSLRPATWIVHGLLIVVTFVLSGTPWTARGVEQGRGPKVELIFRQHHDKPVTEKTRDDTPSANIVGGKPAAPGEWPWMVGLLFSDVPDAYDAQFCGGTLVHPYWVVSAAHCVINARPDEVDVLVGTADLENTSGAQRIPVEEIILHPDFNEVTLDSDLALLRLSAPATVVSTPLPLVDDPSLDAPGILATVIGWGATDATRTAFSPDLMEVQLPIVELAVANAPASHGGRLTDNMLPAGYAEGGKDACAGDSGGPLMVPSPFPPGWMLAGIVSWSGPGPCASPDIYGIYTRVEMFRDFILSYVTPQYGAFEAAHGVAGRDRDPDHDQIVNWVEFSLASDPNVPSVGDLPRIALVTTGTGSVPAIHFSKPILADDVSYGVDYTGDLTEPWMPYDLSAHLDQVDSVPGNPDAEHWTILAPGDLGPDAGFLRATFAASGKLGYARRSLGFPGAIQGSLTDEDPEHPALPGHFMKEYALENVPVGQVMTVSLRSVDFAAMLEIVDADTGIVLTNDPVSSGGGTDDKISFTAETGTNYLLRVSSTSALETGLYTLAVFQIDVSLPVIGVPDSVAGTLDASDELDPFYQPGPGYYKDDFLLNAPGGEAVDITLVSDDFDAFLEVVNAENGRLVDADDDDGGDLNSRLTLTTQAGMTYYLRVTTAGSWETGAYILSTTNLMQALRVQAE